MAILDGRTVGRKRKPASAPTKMKAASLIAPPNVFMAAKPAQTYYVRPPQYSPAPVAGYLPPPLPSRPEALPIVKSSTGSHTYNEIRNLFDAIVTTIDNSPDESSEHSLRGACTFNKDIFAKARKYTNSLLPHSLPPLQMYVASSYPPSALRRSHLPGWPLICLAAQSSQAVYSSPSQVYIPETPLITKATSISISHHAQAIVLAVRGTASFADWAVNLRDEPAPPTKFLDDEGNLCHAGFLSVARRMVRPLASRLRRMLQDASGYSLVFTGHSAGGAVAALLYAHMMSACTTELSDLRGWYRRVHCVTFGSPPVSLLPLRKAALDGKKSMFLSFVNEGDPVTRADRAYVKSLVELLASPAPVRPRRWRVPVCSLSNAGRIVVLRSGQDARGVVAVTCRDEDLRGLIWGDPVAHIMDLYAGRVEELAVRAVTAR